MGFEANRQTVSSILQGVQMGVSMNLHILHMHIVDVNGRVMIISAFMKASTNP